MLFLETRHGESQWICETQFKFKHFIQNFQPKVTTEVNKEHFYEVKRT